MPIRKIKDVVTYICFVGQNKQKKIKKNKMTKMDARILGFSVTAAEGRINVGGRDYVEGP